MKSIDGDFEKRGIHEGDEGLYKTNISQDEVDIELESADNFIGVLDGEEIYEANDYGRATYTTGNFVPKTLRQQAKQEETKALTSEQKRRMEELEKKK